MTARTQLMAVFTQTWEINTSLDLPRIEKPCRNCFRCCSCCNCCCRCCCCYRRRCHCSVSCCLGPAAAAADISAIGTYQMLRLLLLLLLLLPLLLLQGAAAAAAAARCCCYCLKQSVHLLEHTASYHNRFVFMFLQYKLDC